LLTTEQIGSIEGLFVPDHETFAYSTSKAALHHLSRHLAGRLGWEGITSNSIACGPFATKSTYFTKCSRPHADFHEVMAFTLKAEGEKMVKSMPLGRIGVDEDVAGTALFLASAAGRFVTGATIPLDGGILVTLPKDKIMPSTKSKL
jgi:NAD(P)-dependent dehydrogenase (short-subunit alcohol dehydrogenase family)